MVLRKINYENRKIEVLWLPSSIEDGIKKKEIPQFKLKLGAKLTKYFISNEILEIRRNKRLLNGSMIINHFKNNKLHDKLVIIITSEEYFLKSE